MNSLGNFPEKPGTTPRSAMPLTPKSARAHSRVSSSSGSDVSAMMAALTGGLAEPPLAPHAGNLTDRSKRKPASTATAATETKEPPPTLSFEEAACTLKREVSWKERMANVKKVIACPLACLFVFHTCLFVLSFVSFFFIYIWLFVSILI
jgi:hypothetical protein